MSNRVRNALLLPKRNLVSVSKRAVVVIVQVGGKEVVAVEPLGQFGEKLAR